VDLQALPYAGTHLLRGLFGQTGSISQLMTSQVLGWMGRAWEVSPEELEAEATLGWGPALSCCLGWVMSASVHVCVLAVSVQVISLK